MAASKKVKVTERRQRLRFRVTSRGKVFPELLPAVSKARVAAARAPLWGSVRRYDRPLEPLIDPGE